MKKGFTLLELLIVVVILGVLALIAAPALLNATDKAKDAAVKENIATAASTLAGKFATTADTDTAIADTITALQTDQGAVNPIKGTGVAYTAAAPTEGQVQISGDATMVTIQGKCKLAADVDCMKKITPPTTGTLDGIEN
jgi:prepilin-type N-terminal cleavage/methylation domain-containing protein